MHIGLRIFFGFFLIVGLAAFLTLRVFVQEVKPGVRQAMEDTLADTAQVLALLAADDMQQGHIADGAFARRVAPRCGLTDPCPPLHTRGGAPCPTAFNRIRSPCASAVSPRDALNAPRDPGRTPPTPTHSTLPHVVPTGTHGETEKEIRRRRATLWRSSSRG